nr:type I restriction-modification enzyme R subunit C-terminal domain-containing protein [Thiocapsa rosea]
MGDQHLRDFQDNGKTIPTILTTSQKLSTGVDARNVRNIVLMRPVNSMVEFKQIIGRGTRLYDGKNYFTIYDFVKAHHHFSDPEWDGEPIAPETCERCGEYPCVCETPDPVPCDLCGKVPSVCVKVPRPPCHVCGERPCVCRKKGKARVKLADGKERAIQHMTVTSFWHPDGKERAIQHMTVTSFWHPDGTPMSAQQFMEVLFGRLPEFLKDEDELRRLWSLPDTRARLLAGLAEQGFGKEQLAEMQKIIEAEQSDLFDVLAYVGYAAAPLSREERAARAKVIIDARFSGTQQAFLDFVLLHYVQVGVEELETEKLTPLCFDSDTGTR